LSPNFLRAPVAFEPHCRTSSAHKQNGDIPVERLYFSCPSSGHEIDVGIESELGTLLRIRDNRVRARCPHCGEWHEWTVADAHLAKAA
jgi:predicted RNA-binding Zn-ribbon protein involved in translation (DUF1610 family)